MVRVKICGITNNEDAQKAVYYGAWAIGFIFYKKSPRYISASKARKIIEALPPFVTPVGVFVNLKDRAVRDICQFTRIRTLQFHGEEDPGFCRRFKDYKIIKSFRVNNNFDFAEVKKYNVDAYLFDTFQEDAYGGSGRSCNWKLLNGFQSDKPILLSGGLKAENVKEALEEVRPFALDVSSGVEKSPGIKDPRLIRGFFETLNN